MDKTNFYVTKLGNHPGTHKNHVGIGEISSHEKQILIHTHGFAPEEAGQSEAFSVFYYA